MLPKHYQLHAPYPKASVNAYRALVDPPNDGFYFSFDGGDERTNGSDDSTAIIVIPCNSRLPASPQPMNKGIAVE
jgi:hypothetical protein